MPTDGCGARPRTLTLIAVQQSGICAIIPGIPIGHGQGASQIIFPFALSMPSRRKRSSKRTRKLHAAREEETR
jgi:hypothetical protein